MGDQRKSEESLNQENEQLDSDKERLEKGQDLHPKFFCSESNL